MLCISGIVISARASHIVGGEIELQHIQGNQYRLSLILYSDDINIIDPAAIDPLATVHIWSKAGNVRIRSINLPLISKTRIPYTNPDCAIPYLRTSRVVYSAKVELSPEIYTDPKGYYINYERCCRNEVINNIVRPGETGEAFYLEFPAVVKDGKPFVNSSPSLFPPLSDFARLGYPFYFDFRGTDADGDSLVYSLATPLAGYSSPQTGNVLPPPRAAPYPKIQWKSGFSLSNMVPGDPALSISKGGIIQVTPSMQGLFVFSVLVEEYRDGEKIGEVRRDFQMLVYDYEGSDSPPVLTAKKSINGTVYRDAITITDADLANPETNRCIMLQVRDEDGLTEDAENISLKVSPVNFKGNFTDLFLSVKGGVIDENTQMLSLPLCLPLCAPIDGPYTFDVIAYDDACAIPLTDTLRVTVDLKEAKKNRSPQISSSLGNAQLETTSIFKNLGQNIRFNVSGSDPDNDELSLIAVGDGFRLEDYGMEFTPKSGAGPLNSIFNWDPDCHNVNLDKKNFFTIFFITEDDDLCERASSDTLTVNIGITAPQNSPPVLQLLGSGEQTIEAGVDSSLTFELTAFDPNTLDSLRLTLDSISADTTGGRLVYLWEDVFGSNEVQSVLQIDPDCNLFTNGATEYTATFHFSVQDNPCFTEMKDTLSLTVHFKERELDFESVKYINVFTPNGDSINDYFQILNLPKDGCYNQLESIRIFNRWGRTIFETTDPEFRWSGEDYPAGSYYYHVQYTKKIIRSNLSLIRGDNPSSLSN